MSKIFKLNKDPYDTCEILFKKKEVEIFPGVTVLVGCNGTGKTTLLSTIKRRLNYMDGPEYLCIKYDNVKDGGSRAQSRAGFYGDFTTLATAMCSSEGEEITIHLGNKAREIGSMIRRHPDIKELWLLFDAIDSGLSINNIVDVKEYLFKPIIEDCAKNNMEVYIVVSANSYEMASGEQCLDVANCKYREFKTYTAYKNFILRSAKQRESRIEKGAEKSKKKKEKETW